ncbi:hypothetical protein WN55_09374 [Dufourea novaeangliae]|uniref:Uncharacterized protein n=1 Tax=Dufourea novaeangliae TaxID=178035 RepID=A0A154PT46_DUFNO|nr:hypothetical protein WN55_09374 [Dufourea novaeangliae]
MHTQNVTHTINAKPGRLTNENEFSVLNGVAQRSREEIHTIPVRSERGEIK